MSCTVLSKDTISNKEFLELMIRHHTNTIRMCDLALLSSNNDYILNYARKIKGRQEDELFIMNRSLLSMPNIQNDTSCGCDRNTAANSLQFSYPKIFANTECIESDFAVSKPLDTEVVSYNVHGMCNNIIKVNENISDCDFVDNMFMHLKSAVELAQLLLQSTKEPRLFVLAQTIIADENKEMFELTFLKNNLYNWKKLIPTKFYNL
jgi:hypothetical protein